MLKIRNCKSNYKYPKITSPHNPKLDYLSWSAANKYEFILIYILYCTPSVVLFFFFLKTIGIPLEVVIHLTENS